MENYIYENSTIKWTNEGKQYCAHIQTDYNNVFYYTLYIKICGEWSGFYDCGGFYGNDIEKNGMLEYIGNGLPEAIKNNTAIFGKAQIIL